MTRHSPSCWRSALASVLCAAFLATPALGADEHGHDHGAEPSAQGAPSPRVEAHSALFELVGIVDKGQLTIYLDRYATNEPVVGAKVEFVSGAATGVAAPQPDGTYLAKLDALSKPGRFPLAFTVTAGSETSQLAGEIAIAKPHDEPEHAGRPWARWAGYGAAALAALLIAAAFLRKRAQARRNSP